MDSPFANRSRARTLSPHRFQGLNDHVARPKTADLSTSPFPVSRHVIPRHPLPEHERTNFPPRKHMMETQAWVVEQESIRHDRQNLKTERWVNEQVLLADRSNHRRTKSTETEAFRCRMWDELMYEYEADAHRWMRHEEELRRKVQEREQEKSRVVQDEIRRIQARVRQRRDSERQTIAEERMREAERAKERVRRERAKADRAMAEAWSAYESRWATLPTSSGPLTFQEIPWPLLVPPTSAEEICTEDIAAFVLSPVHSSSQSRKERIRTALLRWHPDRFRRLLSRIGDDEKAAVEGCVGSIARSLNELLSKESRASRHAL
ncbi:hypothetical protein BV22DRAFT_1128959 [Leucogyrophana mollusca]|uniref:Uncharacterized protein n=1 Tax=Leucogyrophana mollusca TaxID=85980 RepID=A0ACB8BI70_9AGAM|nr:hypothetical protein BV22DRAFT_1128959 [Leucogyrophana mollusca]